VQRRQLIENVPAPGRQLHAYQTTIAGNQFLAYQTGLLRAVHEADDGVMTLLEKFGEFGNGRPAAAGVARDAQQELVLLRRQPGLARRLLAEAEKAPELVAESGQLPNRR